MNIRKTTTLAAEDAKRRPFLPVQMDLVDRLTRECDTLSSPTPCAAPDRPGDSHKFAA